jgi:CheY-like chemotaxis protein
MIEGLTGLVLVVDYEALRLRRLSNELARRGHTVLTASSARAAERLVADLGLPMVVVLDLDVQGTSGLDLLRSLSSRQDADKLRFILISANSSLNQEAPQNPLVVGRLLKPVDPPALSAMIVFAGADLAHCANAVRGRWRRRDD